MAKDEITNKEPTKKELTLADLQVQDEAVSPELAQTLEKRKTMLNVHKYLAWATTAAMIATLATAPEGKEASSGHKAMGITTGVLYAGTATFAALAPRPETMQDTKNMVWHKRLIWIHAPAMLLAAVSGIAANKDYKDGKKPSGLGDLHKSAAKVAAIPFFISFGLTLYEF